MLTLCRPCGFDPCTTRTVFAGRAHTQPQRSVLGAAEHTQPQLSVLGAAEHTQPQLSVLGALQSAVPCRPDRGASPHSSTLLMGLVIYTCLMVLLYRSAADSVIIRARDTAGTGHTETPSACAAPRRPPSGHNAT